jgi:hypothetical protein
MKRSLLRNAKLAIVHQHGTYRPELASLGETTFRFRSLLLYKKQTASTERSLSDRGIAAQTLRAEKLLQLRGDVLKA